MVRGRVGSPEPIPGSLELVRLLGLVSHAVLGCCTWRSGVLITGSIGIQVIKIGALPGGSWGLEAVLNWARHPTSNGGDLVTCIVPVTETIGGYKTHCK